MSKGNKGGQRPQGNGSGTELVKTDSGAEGVAPGTSEAAAADPFADVPTVNIGDDVSFQDFTDTPTGDPRKYSNVHAAAVGDRLPTAKNWKHERAMLIPGSNRKEFKEGSVYGTIQQIVNAAGRAGIPAYVVATMLRRKQVGNKRSVYCMAGEKGALPAIGWAEGWLNTAITKGIVNTHATKQAPALRETVTEGESNAQKADAQGKIAANG